MVQFDSPVRRKYGQGRSQELELEDKEIFIKKNLCKCTVQMVQNLKMVKMPYDRVIWSMVM